MRTWRVRISILAMVALVASALLFTHSRPAHAVSPLTINVSTPDDNLGSFVNVSWSAPTGASCVVDFMAPGPGAPSVTAMRGGSSGSGRFVIPAYLGHGVFGTYQRVLPGQYQFRLTCAGGGTTGAQVVTLPFGFTGALPASRFVGIAPGPSGMGYWLVQRGGGVFGYGSARFYGSLPGIGVAPRAPVVGIAATPDGRGYWLAGGDGGVYAFGDAGFYGSLPSSGVRASAPIVGIASDPGGGGYWLVGADGGVYAFGAAGYLGSAPLLKAVSGRGAPPPGTAVSSQVVGMAASSDARTYYEAISSGGALSFGASNRPLAAAPSSATITGMAATPGTGSGWLVAADGGVFAVSSMGVAPPTFYGSLPSVGVATKVPVVGIAATPDGHGYWLVGSDGGVFAFGDAPFLGSAAH